MMGQTVEQVLAEVAAKKTAAFHDQCVIAAMTALTVTDNYTRDYIIPTAFDMADQMVAERAYRFKQKGESND